MSKIRYRQVHLDFHTSEYIPDIAADFDKEEFAKTLEEAHVDSITCFARCHHGWLYYPSKKFPELIHPGLKNKNFLLEQIEACHKRGIKVPVYTTAQWDGRIMREHPEWLSVDENGEFIDTQGVPAPHFYHTICLNSGYRQFFKDQLQDMIEVIGVENLDGIFMDILFQVDCKCEHCVRKMQELGMDTVSKVERMRYAEHMLDEFKTEISEFIHSMAPEATIFYNGSHVGPRSKNSFKEYSHLELESLPSGGWGYDHFPATSRYARNLGKEMIGMTGKFHTYWGDFHSLKNQAALEYECFHMLAVGAGCSIGDQLHPRGVLSKGAYDLIGNVYKSVEEKEPYCRDVKARTEIAVITPEEFYPEDAKDSVLSPSLIGTVRILQELGYQFDIIDSQMPLDDYQVVILPDCIYYNEDLKQKMEAYLAQGGHVIGSFDSCLPKDGSESIYGVAFEKESEYYREFVMPNDVIGKDLPKEEFVMYLRGYDVKPVHAEVLMDKIEPYFDRKGNTFCSHQHAPSSGKVGSPEVTIWNNALYFSHPVFALYRKNAARWCKLMVKDALEYFIGEKLVKYEGPSTLNIQLNAQEEKNRDVLHILHYITEKRSEDIYTVEDKIPLYDLEIQVNTDGKQVKEVRSVPDETPLSFVQEGKYVKFSVKKVDGHQMICIQY